MSDFKFKLKAMSKDDNHLTSTDLRQSAKFQKLFEKISKKKVLE